MKIIQLRLYKILGFISLFASVATYGQTVLSPAVIGAAGEISKTEHMTLEWTLGETFIESAKNGTSWHTQGYHQPLLLIRPDARPKSSIEVHIYPNPTKELLNVNVSTGTLEPLVFKMIDVTGRIVLLEITSTGSQDVKLKMNHLPDGMYMLSVVGQDGAWIKSFKVIKH